MEMMLNSVCMECGVKNTFVILVYSEQDTSALLLYLNLIYLWVRFQELALLQENARI
jgi:hypothetical protein